MALSGSKNGNWKGGVSKGTHGYLMLTSGPHARKFKLQHRDLMERHLGRKLGSDEIIHHKNGDKTDNRIANMEIMTRADHMAEHRVEILANNNPVIGVDHHNAKLTPEAVLDMRARRAAGEPLSAIARIYGIDRKTARSAIQGKTWRHVL
jgi:hypothetical protein